MNLSTSLLINCINNLQIRLRTNLLFDFFMSSLMQLLVEYHRKKFQLSVYWTTSERQMKCPKEQYGSHAVLRRSHTDLPQRSGDGM